MSFATPIPDDVVPMKFDDSDARIARLELEPGDLVVFEFPRPLSPESMTRVEHILARILPPGVRPLVLDGGVRLAGVLARKKSGADAAENLELPLKEPV